MVEASVLYYKHMMIVNVNSSIVSKWSSKLIDDTRVIIYVRNMFIIQATDRYISEECWASFTCAKFAAKPVKVVDMEDSSLQQSLWKPW
jgi:hypothetical protein